MNRREFVSGSAMGVALTTTGGRTARAGHRVPAHRLEEWTVRELQREATAGRLSARSLVETYFEAIAALNVAGPQLRAIIETNPEALEIADALDAERRQTGPRSLLHGIPVVLKDNINTHDRMNTAAGSRAFEGSTASDDAFVVRKLRAAGAIILAKSNMSEWSYARAPRQVSGWSARGGQCRNPYALDRSPGGSSSGSAVAVSAHLATLAIGTDTAGSILGPASVNGLVGVRPTVGLVSRDGIIPFSSSRDTAGPMARTVYDVAVLLGAMCGADPRDSATAQSADKGHRDYIQFLDGDGLRGIRIGVARDISSFHEKVRGVFEDALHAMKNLGATLVDDVRMPALDWKAFAESWAAISRHELKTGINHYLARRGHDSIRSLSDVIAYNERHREEEMPFFGQENFVAADLAPELSNEDYQLAIARSRKPLQDYIDGEMEARKLDAFVAPMSDVAWLTDPILRDRVDTGFGGIASISSGYPNITVPMGASWGLPVGLSVFGRAWSEPMLFRIAYAYEQATRHRRMPTFRNCATQ